MSRPGPSSLACALATGLPSTSWLTGLPSFRLNGSATVPTSPTAKNVADSTATYNPLMQQHQLPRLGIVGAGVMAEALIAGVVERKLIPAAHVIASHPRDERREEL